MSSSPYDAAALIAKLQVDLGKPALGLLVQALFAHVLIRMGGRVLDILNPGHPDIVAVLEGRVHMIEVEVAYRKRPLRRLQSGDLRVLQSRPDGERGFFCVLDSGPPLRWLCVDAEGLGYRLAEDLRMSILRAYSDQEYSLVCTREFCDLILQEASSIGHLSFSQLRHEALSGKGR